MSLYIDQHAVVKTTRIGDRTSIWQFVVVLEEARIGENCNINCHCFIENDVTIGNNVTVKSGVSLWNGITLEDDVFIGPNVAFTNDLYPRSKRRPDKFSRTVVCRGASIGANATIVAGITLGKYCLIGAGSVVTADVPDHALFYGNPAHHNGYVCECGNRLDDAFTCIVCGTDYLVDGPTIVKKS